MRYLTATSILTSFISAGLCHAQPVHITLGTSVYNGVPGGFSAGIALDVYNPWGAGYGYGLYGSTRLVSPGGVAGDWTPDSFGGWSGYSATREGVIALMNGRWTLQYEDAFDGTRADYYFDVSISGVDSNDLAPLNIISPRPGSTISSTPTFSYESAFILDHPEDGVGIIFETLDVERVNNGRCTFATPLRDGTYGAGIQLFRDRPIDEVFTVSNAGYSGTTYGGLNFSAGPLRLTTWATVSGLVVPAPGAAALLGLGGLLVARRRR